jgi:thioredoxin 2
MMGPVYDHVAAEMEPAMRFLKLDTEAEPQLAERYGVRGIPTLMVFRHDRILGQRAGAVGAGPLRQWLRQHAHIGAAQQG